MKGPEGPPLQSTTGALCLEARILSGQHSSSSTVVPAKAYQAKAVEDVLSQERESRPLTVRSSPPTVTLGALCLPRGPSQGVTRLLLENLMSKRLARINSRFAEEAQGLLTPGLDKTRLFMSLTAGAGTRCQVFSLHLQACGTLGDEGKRRLVASSGPPDSNGCHRQTLPRGHPPLTDKD